MKKCIINSDFYKNIGLKLKIPSTDIQNFFSLTFSLDLILDFSFLSHY